MQKLNIQTQIAVYISMNMTSLNIYVCVWMCLLLYTKETSSSNPVTSESNTASATTPAPNQTTTGINNRQRDANHERQLRLYLKIKSWTSVIKRYIRDSECERMEFTTRGRCETVKVTPFKFMRFYIAPPRRNVMYTAVLPRDKLLNPASHYSVIVVDPFPTASYGHLVFIFYIDGATPQWCRMNSGIVLGSGLCLRHAKKNHCTFNYAGRVSNEEILRCEVGFIPLVYNGMRDDLVREQMLQCVSKLSGFGECHSGKDVVESLVKENCELKENTHRCYVADETKGASDIVSPCTFYQTCDQAVAVFGGWNKNTNMVKHHHNIKAMFTMLRRNGYTKDSIQVFFNGNGKIQLNEPYSHGLPASSKGSIRNHIDTLCSSPLCVDTLVVYFNGPTTNDGDLLLWDKNGNGEADESEVYSIREILNDVEHCSAKLVYIFADQSHAGLLANALVSRKQENPASYDNVALFSSSDPLQYSWDREATSHWGRLSHLRSASWTVNGMGFVRSHSTIVNEALAENYTIYGAPVTRGVPPHATNFPVLKQKYMGCQMQPSPRWKFSFFRPKQEDANEET